MRGVVIDHTGCYMINQLADTGFATILSRHEHRLGDRPIRVIDGTNPWALFTVTDWSAEELSLAATTRDEVDETGITLVNSGALFDVSSWDEERPHSDDGQAIYDCASSSLHSPAVYVCDSSVIAEAAPRMIVFRALISVINDCSQLGPALDELLEPALTDETLGERILEIINTGSAEVVSAVLNSRSSTFIQELLGQIRNSEEAIQHAQLTISNHSNQLRERQAAMDAAIAVSSNGIDEDTVARELATLDRNEAVTGYFMSDKKLFVIVKPLPISDQGGDQAFLGPYRITLDFELNTTSIHNMVNPRNGYDHPHVHNGAFCAGEWGPTVQQLLRNAEISAALSFIIECLQQVNYQDEWGRNHRWWFDTSYGPIRETTDHESMWFQNNHVAA